MTDDANIAQKIQQQYRVVVFKMLKLLYGIDATGAQYQTSLKQSAVRYQLLPIDYYSVMRDNGQLSYCVGTEDFCWLFNKKDLRDYYQQIKPATLDVDAKYPEFGLPLVLAYEMCVHAFALAPSGISRYQVCVMPPDSKLASCIGCPHYIADGYRCDTKFGRELRLFLSVRDTIVAAILQTVAIESPLPINDSDIGGDDND